MRHRHNDEQPLAAYAALMGAWCLGFGGFLARQGRRKRLPRRVELRDLLVLGLATHKLSRTITRERVTAPVRAPFTERAGDEGSGQVHETPRGGELRRAIGYLVTCPYCVGPWVAGSLVCGLVAAPAPTRLMSSVFAAVTVADFLHQGFDALSARTRALRAMADSPDAGAAGRPL